MTRHPFIECLWADFIDSEQAFVKKSGIGCPQGCLFIEPVELLVEHRPLHSLNR